MKKIITSIILVSALFTSVNAKIYTGTSVTAGAGNYGYHTRIDQYIGESSYTWIYGKIGVSQESFDYNEGIEMAWGCSGDCTSADQNAPLSNDVTSLVIGLGFNLYQNGGFFVDSSIDYYLELNSDDLVGKSVKTVTNAGPTIDTIVSHGSFNSPAVELGIGYSFDNVSIRFDINYLTNTPKITIEHYFINYSNSGYQSEEFDTRIYLGLGLTYWW